RPNANFGSSLPVTRSDATSDYHALQLEFQRRLSRGLAAFASYTWSHSIDNVSSDQAFERFIPGLDNEHRRGPSDFDVRHAFNDAMPSGLPSPPGRFAGALLGHFSVDPIFRARTGTPFNVIAGAFGTARADLVPDVPLYVADPSAPGGRRVNRAA